MGFSREKLDIEALSESIPEIYAQFHLNLLLDKSISG